MDKAKLLTPELQETICGYIADGHGALEACRLARVSKSTYYRLLEQGEKDRVAGQETLFTAFLEAVGYSEATLEEDQLAKIRRASDRVWQASAWLLERRFPERWSLRNRVQVMGPDGEAITLRVVFEAEHGKDSDAETAETA